MNVKCDFCVATATGTRDELADKGWARAIIFTPVRMTITACRDHQKEAAQKLVDVLPKRFKKK